MRFVVYGAGAIGGTIGARLHLAGFDVALIARGPHLEAMSARGLRFVSPTRDVLLRLPCFAQGADAGIGADDAVLLCAKGQHSEAALRELYAATGGAARVVCCQNGVENERLALRRFERVYGMVVWLPAEHLEPGVVVNFAEDTAGGLDAGRYPSGVDPFILEVTEALTQAGFSAAAHPNIMGYKYEKLLANLNNAVQAATGGRAASRDAKDQETLRDISRLLREEALACYRAAGVYCAPREEALAVRADIRAAPVPGRERHGGSSLQSVLRVTGDIETDFLNGEIVLLGRLHGVPTPANAAVQQVGNRLARDGVRAGMTVAELAARIARASGRAE